MIKINTPLRKSERNIQDIFNILTEYNTNCQFTILLLSYLPQLKTIDVNLKHGKNGSYTELIFINGEHLVINDYYLTTILFDKF